MDTPTLDQVLQDAQRLPLEDRRALATLIKPPKPLAEIAAEQGVKPFDYEEARGAAAGIWPEEDDIDEFVATLRAWRNEGKERLLD